MLMTHNFFSPFILQIFRQASLTFRMLSHRMITSCMTSNLLSLNSSKTELLLIGLKRQLSKIHNSSTSIDTTQSAGTLASYSTNIFPYLIRYLHCLNPATITFVLSAVSVLPWPSQRNNSCLFLFHTRSLTTVTICTLVSEISNKSSPIHPEWFCLNYCPGSKIQTHHSCSEISSLAWIFWTNWI